MPRVRLSAGFDDIKGKQGGSVWSSNRGGLYFRNNKSKGHNATMPQNRKRILISWVAGAWRSLSDAMKDDWTTAAPNFPTTDIFGNPRIPTGYELFMRLNMNIANQGLSIRPTPPAPHAIPPITLIEFSSLTQSTMVVGFNEESEDNSKFIVYGARPVSKGVISHPSSWKQIAFERVNDSLELNLFNAYIAKFQTPQVGTKVFLKFVFMWYNEGIKSTPYYISGITT